VSRFADFVQYLHSSKNKLSLPYYYLIMPRLSSSHASAGPYSFQPSSMGQDARQAQLAIPPILEASRSQPNHGEEAEYVQCRAVISCE
jgi:hypothetical protein